VLDRGYADFREFIFEKLSEKGYEQRSNREFGRHAGREIGQKGLLTDLCGDC
jgi:hypothetical protein